MSNSIELPVPESQVLGTHQFEGVLFSSETETPVNVMTGETPEHSQASLEDAKEFAKYLSAKNDKPYVAKKAPVETQIETQSSPYTGCVFFHFSIVGGMEMHEAFSAVWDSPEYTVDVTDDYETGTLTIRVTK